MRRLTWLLLLIAPLALADRSIEREYGVATTVDICLPSYASPVDFEPAATFAAGDVTVMKDEGTETNIGTLPTDEGNCYSFPLTAAEMQAARVTVRIEDQTNPKVWADTAVYIDTFGNASAEHDDLGSAAFVAAFAAESCASPAVGSFEERLCTYLADVRDDTDEMQQDDIPSLIGGLNDISVTDLRGLVIEDQGSITLGCALAAILAREAGDWAGTTSVVYQDATGTETRVTVDLATADQRDGTITCPTY